MAKRSFLSLCMAESLMVCKINIYYACFNFLLCWTKRIVQSHHRRSKDVTICLHQNFFFKSSPRDTTFSVPSFRPKFLEKPLKTVQLCCILIPAAAKVQVKYSLRVLFFGVYSVIDFSFPFSIHRAFCGVRVCVCELCLKREG